MTNLNSYFVYIHRHKITNKCYIGITCQQPEKRWGNCGINYLKQTKDCKYHQPKFARAILKDGWDAFEHIILFKNLSMQEAKIKEQDLIKKYDSINNGYNITAGGESNKRYFTVQEYQAAYERNTKKAYITRTNKLKSNQLLKSKAKETRHQWYITKSKTPEYHSYLLEKSKISHAKHKAKLSPEQKAQETRRHTEQTQKGRALQAAKKAELQNFIAINKIKLTSKKAQAYIESIKWYKLQSMKSLLEIEKNLYELINEGGLACF